MAKVFSNSYYNKVYKKLSDDYSDEEAFEIIHAWRSQHVYVLSRASKLLEKVVKQLNLKKSYIGQRLKRMDSIKRKLIKSNGMRLTKMQDIAGVRLVVNDLDELFNAKNLLCSQKLLGKNIELIKEYDYVNYAKSDGYRSIHLIYAYNTNSKGIKKTRLFEVQIRTQAQHAWSTVVETLGTYLGIDFKFGEGNQDWASFFISSSYLFSWFEKFDYKTNKLHQDDIYKLIKSSIELKEIMLKLKVRELLKLINDITVQINEKFTLDGYAIVYIDYIERLSRVRTFPRTSLKTAKATYKNIEKELIGISQIQVLFVEVTDLTNLRKAFPNFYIDVEEFIQTYDRYFQALNNQYQIYLENKKET